MKTSPLDAVGCEDAADTLGVPPERFDRSALEGNRRSGERRDFVA